MQMCLSDISQVKTIQMEIITIQLDTKHSIQIRQVPVMWRMDIMLCIQIQQVIQMLQ